MSESVVLDLFCKAGGSAAGWKRAGFRVLGVDKDPQPNYAGDEFIQADAIKFLAANGGDFAIRSSSPPCQWACAYRRKGHGVGDGYPNLIPVVRELCRWIGGPYVIENVEQARPHMIDPVRLCGSSFRLDVRRHRLFEANVPLSAPTCDHAWQTPRFTPASNRTNLRRTVEVGVWRIPLDVQQRAMGIDWMTREELSEAIPPAYTEHLGHQLAAHLAEGLAA